MKKSVWQKLFKSLFRLLVPALSLLILAIVAASVWLVHRAANPPRAGYLVTPERFAQFTTKGLEITDEKWSNKDGTGSRGWLVRGAENAPAVVLLHRYGTDRSWLLNLGVKLREATNFTVLIPDQRGHGENPLVNFSSFGGGEAEDLVAAVEFLRGLKTKSGKNQTGEKIGVYGVEMGAIAAVFGAEKEKAIQALALDSVPENSEDVLESSVKARSSMFGEFAYQIACRATYLYYRNGFRHEYASEAAKNLNDRRVLLLAGKDAPELQSTTNELSKSFTDAANVQIKTDLQPSGYNLINTATPAQEDAYDKIVIEFFLQSLS
jgi:pimeloyl-ACP methyl ester carboxylesterase